MVCKGERGVEGFWKRSTQFCRRINGEGRRGVREGKGRNGLK